MATARPAAVSGPAPSGRSATTSTAAAMTPSSSPTAGAHAIAAATVARRGSVTGSRSGMTVSSVTDSLSPLHLMPNEPNGGCGGL